MKNISKEAIENLNMEIKGAHKLINQLNDQIDKLTTQRSNVQLTVNTLKYLCKELNIKLGD
jgi:prefoldin subunit 5